MSKGEASVIKHWTDRSRVITYQHCKRERYLTYSFDGMGIVAKRLPMRMAVGIAVHAGLASLLTDSMYAPHGMEHEDAAVKTALQAFAPFVNELDLDTSEQAAMQSTGDTVTQLAQSLGLPETDPTVTGLAERVGERRSRFDQYLAREQSALVEACVRAYSRRRLQPLLEQFEVLEVEREGTWKLAAWDQDFLPSDYDGGTSISDAMADDPRSGSHELWFMSRPDALLRERSTGELYIQSFKTTGAWDIRKERDAQHDMQGLSEGIEIERRLARLWEYWHGTSMPEAARDYGLEDQTDATWEYIKLCKEPPRIHAIRYEYILTGERWKDKELSAQLEMECRSQRSHLIRCYEAVSVSAKSSAFSVGDLCWSWDYIRLDDMKESSLAWQNWRSRPVWERDGGVRAWIDKLADAAPLMSGEDSTVGMEPREMGYKSDAQAMGVTKQHPLDAAFIPPIVIWRNDDDLRDLVEEMESQEVQIVEHVGQVEAARDEGERRSLLNRYFPRSLRSCNYPSSCAYIPICFGGQDIRSNPLGSGLYKIREVNHPQELDQVKNMQDYIDSMLARQDALVADKVKEAVSLERKNWLEEGWGKSAAQQIEEAVEAEANRIGDKISVAVPMPDSSGCESGDVADCLISAIRQAIAEAVAKEREACAAVIDTEIKISLRALAAAIRGRG